MVAVVGNQKKFELVKEVNKLFDFEVIHFQERNIKRVCDTLLKGMYSDIVIDVDFVTGDVDSILNELKKVNIATTSRIIVLVAEKVISDVLIEELSPEIQDFVTGGFDAEIKKELIQIFGQNNEQIPPKPTSDPVGQKLNKPEQLFEKSVHKTIMIAVAGALHRIGTTTQALQIVKFLAMQNKSVCYVEMNGYNYLSVFPDMYDNIVEDTSIGCIHFEGVQMYYKPQNIDDIIKQEYDFIVYDFGVFSDANLVQFLEKDIKIIVCGAKPYELYPMGDVFTQLDEKEVYYLFSFVHANDVLAVSTSMGSKCKYTFFPAYTPSLVNYSSDNIKMHQSIFGKYLTSQDKEEKPVKRGFFFGRKAR